MDIIFLIIGVALIVLGIMIIKYYQGLKKSEKNGLSIKLIGGGVGFILIGIALIFREISKLA